MAQQLSDIKTDAFDVLGYNSNDPLFDDTVMTRLVNTALAEVSTEFDWPWLYAEGTISVTASTTDYALSGLTLSGLTRWTKTKWVAIEEDELKFVSPRQMQRIIGDTSVTGQPLYYTHDGTTNIRFGPTPDAAYTVTIGYQQGEAALSNSTDTPVIPNDYDQYLVLYVAKKMAMRKGAFDDLRVVQGEIAEWRKRIRDNVRQASAFPSIRNRQDWSSRV